MNQPFNPAFAAYGAPAAPAAGYAMAPYGGYGMVAFGADPPAPTFTDKAKAFLDDKTLGVQNKYLLGGATVGALLWYGAGAGWFR